MLALSRKLLTVHCHNGGCRYVRAKTFRSLSKIFSFEIHTSKILSIKYIFWVEIRLSVKVQSPDRQTFAYNMHQVHDIEAVQVDLVIQPVNARNFNELSFSCNKEINFQIQ